MKFSRRVFSKAAIATAAQIAGPAFSQSNKVKIGVLTDMSGPLSSVLGMGSVEGARMAIEEFGKTVAGMQIELVHADHRNKPDIGAATARRWIDEEQVDMLLDVGNSAVAIACQSIARDKDKIAIVTGASSSDITNKFCNTHSFHWGYDTYMQGAALAAELARRGGDSWFFITVDYSYGHALEGDARKALMAQGGQVSGRLTYPPNMLDMSSLLLQAQASRAKVIGITGVGDDLERLFKQGNEFGLWKKQKAAPFSLQLYNVLSIGVDTMQGMLHNTIYYWDRDEKTRDLARRFWKLHGKPPAETHAVNYSATLQYLKAIKAAGTKETAAVLKALRTLPVDDLVTRNGKVRADGRLIRPTHLVEIKNPKDVKERWDVFNVVSEISAENSFRPLSESVCPLVKS